jgi:hypothetical protein
MRSQVTIKPLLAALLIIAPARIFGGVNEWTARGPEGGYVEPPAVDPQNPSVLYVSAGAIRVTLFKSTGCSRTLERDKPSSRAVGCSVAEDPGGGSTELQHDLQ